MKNPTFRMFAQKNRGVSMQFSQTFKMLCKEKKITQQQALLDLDLNRNATQRWSQGIPAPHTLKKIAEYFGVSVDALLGVEQKNPVTENGNGISDKKAGLIQKVMQMSDAELERLDLLLQIVEAKK